MVGVGRGGLNFNDLQSHFFVALSRGIWGPGRSFALEFLFLSRRHLP